MTGDRVTCRYCQEVIDPPIERGTHHPSSDFPVCRICRRKVGQWILKEQHRLFPDVPTINDPPVEELDRLQVNWPDNPERNSNGEVEENG